MIDPRRYRSPEQLIAEARTLEESASALKFLLYGGFGIWTDGRPYHIRERIEGFDRRVCRLTSQANRATSVKASFISWAMRR